MTEVEPVDNSKLAHPCQTCGEIVDKCGALAKSEEKRYAVALVWQPNVHISQKSAVAQKCTVFVPA